MIGIILVSENKEGEEMLKAARRLLGRLPGVSSLALRPGHPVKTMQEELRKAISSLHADQGVLLLTDVFGSTQCNVCRKFLKKGAVELVTGFNFPMLVKLCTLRQTMLLQELVPFIESYGREHIKRVV